MPQRIDVPGMGVVEFPDGMSDQDIVAAIQRTNNSQGQFNEKVKSDELAYQKARQDPGQDGNESFLSSVPRQVGLAARYMIEGPLEFAGIFSNPIAYGLSKITGEPVQTAGELGSGLADKIGLPSPETGQERIVGQASKLLTGIAGQPRLAAKAATGVKGVAGDVLNRLAQAPAAQLMGAAAGGAAGETVKESGGGAGAQFAGAIAGGLVGASIPNIANKILSGLQGSRASIDQIRSRLSDELKRSGIEVGDIPESVRSQLIKEMKSAYDAGRPINVDVARRLADHAFVGTTPTRGSVTLDPIHITHEKNLAKLAANSSSPELQRLARTIRQNDKILIDRLNDLGAGSASDKLPAGAKIMDALREIDAPRKATVDAAYRGVRDASGRYAQMDVPTFSRLANNALDEGQLGAVLPKPALEILNNISSGKTPLNVNTFIQVDKTLNGLAADAYRTGNREAAKAVLAVKTALNETPVSGSAGKEAISLYETARRLASNRFRAIERNPAMQASLDDAAPDKFVETYIIGSGSKSNLRDVSALSEELKSKPEAFQAAREQIVSFLKEKALSGNADEVANFSPSRFNRALQSIGQDKLKLFLYPEEVRLVNALSRVSSYNKFQPSGSAVNNSNTSSALAGLFERVARSPLLSSLPFGRSALIEPAQAISSRSGARSALNPLREVAGPANRPVGPTPASLLAPALAGSSN